ncbi:hypothetical protein C8R44DRAFT_738152 [Mycena epipterygia]|nr:hypothetical protein C8R44DRAFT_738152 [Mycena epipterygia]
MPEHAKMLLTRRDTLMCSDLAVAQLTSLLSSPDQPIFKLLLDSLVKKIVEDGLLVVPNFASNPRNDGSRDEFPPRDIPHASVESGDGSSKTKGKGKAKADAPLRVELPAPGPDAPTTPQPRAPQYTTSLLISSGSLRFDLSLHIGGTSSSSIAGFAAGVDPPTGLRLNLPADRRPSRTPALCLLVPKASHRGIRPRPTSKTWLSKMPNPRTPSQSFSHCPAHGPLFGRSFGPPMKTTMRSSTARRKTFEETRWQPWKHRGWTRRRYMLELPGSSQSPPVEVCGGIMAQNRASSERPA